MLIGLQAQSAARNLTSVTLARGTDPEVADRLRREYEKHLRVLRAAQDAAAEEPALRYERHYNALRLATIASKRATTLRLRDEQRIDDTVLRQLQARLDIEEVRLSRPAPVD